MYHNRNPLVENIQVHGNYG